MGWSRYTNSGWSPSLRLTWEDPSWIGVEEVRRQIRLRVLDP